MSTIETHTLLPIASGRQTWVAVRSLLRPRRLRLALATLVFLAASASGLAMPALLGVIVGVVTQRPEDGVTRVVLLAVAIVVAGLAAAALTALGQTLLAAISEQALADLREDVVDRVLDLPLHQVEEAGDGDVVSRVSGDVESVSLAATSVLPSMVGAVFSVAVTFAGLSVLDWRFALASLAAVPLQLWSLRQIRRRTPPIYRAVRVAEGRRAEVLLEAVDGAPTVLALGTAPEHIAAVARTSQEAIRSEMRGIAAVTRFYNGLNFAELIGLAAVLVVGFYLVDSGAGTVAATTAAALFFHRLFGPMGTLLGQVDDLALAGAGLARLVGVAGLPTTRLSVRDTSAIDAPELKKPQVTAPAITLTSVTFGYRSGRAVLSDFSLQIAPGESVALVGTSGAGKSTVARLVAGTVLPGSGRVALGEQVAHEVHHERPGYVVMVDQDVHTFIGTIAQDLRLADPRASEDDLAAAMSAVGAQWVQDLPEGLATQLGPDGITLRPDQAQQIALARALLADPAVVVLDEATADAPRSQQRAVDTALRAVLHQRTGLLVVHRLDQAMLADRIVVMEHGRIVQQGEPEALRSEPGPFRTLWQAWSA